jgi:hypothetical protein
MGDGKNEFTIKPSDSFSCKLSTSPRCTFDCHMMTYAAGSLNSFPIPIIAPEIRRGGTGSGYTMETSALPLNLGHEAARPDAVTHRDVFNLTYWLSMKQHYGFYVLKDPLRHRMTAFNFVRLSVSWMDSATVQPLFIDSGWLCWPTFSSWIPSLLHYTLSLAILIGMNIQHRENLLGYARI